MHPSSFSNRNSYHCYIAVTVSQSAERMERVEDYSTRGVGEIELGLNPTKMLYRALSSDLRLMNRRGEQAPKSSRSYRSFE